MVTQRIIRNIHIVSNKLTRQLDNILSSQGITHMQFVVLKFILDHTKDGGEVFQKNLEYSFSIRPSSVSSILTLLEEKGFLKRVSVKNDARLRKILLTPQGEEKLKQVTAKVDAFEQELCSLFSTEERSLFFNILDILYNYPEE